MLLYLTNKFYANKNMNLFNFFLNLLLKKIFFQMPFFFNCPWPLYVNCNNVMPLQQVLIYYIDFAIIWNQAYNRRMNDGPFERWFCWFFCINFFSLDRIKSCKSASLTRIDDTWCWHCYLCPKVRCVSVSLMCVYNGPVPWKSPVISSRSGAIKKVASCKFAKMDTYMQL